MDHLKNAIATLQKTANDATDEAEDWLLNDEGLYDFAMELISLASSQSELAKMLEYDLASTFQDMEYFKEDTGDIDWHVLAGELLGW